MESLRTGDFNIQLLRVIKDCNDVLLVLPPGGLDRCINDPEDWVRKEIVCALENKKNIIPVMKRNFVFPDHLPEDIEPIRNKQGISAAMDFFDAVVDKIASKYLTSKPKGEGTSDEELRKLSEEGDPSAANELGIRFELGTNSIMPTQMTSHQAALYYFELAAKLGNNAGYYNLAAIYEKCAFDLTLISDYRIDISNLTKDPEIIRTKLFEIAEQYYNIAAKNNYPAALYRLGNFKENNKCLDEALVCYKEAAEQGYVPAQNALGFFYQNGIAVKMNLEKAEQYYQLAADAGFTPAIYNLAALIEAKDPDKAVDYYQRVAYGDDGIPQASYALGRCYEKIYNDIPEAVSCYRIAYGNGVIEAGEALQRCQNIIL